MGMCFWLTRDKIRRFNCLFPCSKSQVLSKKQWLGVLEGGSLEFPCKVPEQKPQSDDPLAKLREGLSGMGMSCLEGAPLDRSRETLTKENHTIFGGDPKPKTNALNCL